MTPSKIADRSPRDEDPRKTGPVSHPILNYRLLAERWGISARTILNMNSRDPASLPATIHPPGARGPRWRLQDVEAFEQHLRDTALYRPSSPIILAAQKKAEEEDGGRREDPALLRSLPYFTYRRLGHRWHVDRRTLANIHARTPEILPPETPLPGARGPRWHIADIEAYEARLRMMPDGRPPRVAPPSPTPSAPPTRKRGRPRIVDTYGALPQDGRTQPKQGRRGPRS